MPDDLYKVVIAAALAALAFAVIWTAFADAAEPTPDPYSYALDHGCKYEHPSADSYRATTRLLKNHRVATGRTKRRVHKWAVCVATRAKAHAVHEHVRKLWAWRHRYEHVWPIRRSAIDAGILARLGVLRGCETRGLSFWASYTQDGHHKGAYQYAISTWSRAQAYYQTVTGRKVIGWTWSAHVSSPAHQDVITAVFFPAHTGEWACRA